MKTRRFFISLSLLFPAWLTGKAKQASESEIYSSFEARDWARHFVSAVKRNPTIAFDEETMTAWFASSLMRGWDERNWEHAREVKSTGKTFAQRYTEESVRGAVARGWCSEACQHKEMDVVLAESISQEILALK